METSNGQEPVIDPEVKAHVFSLVSALGGSSAGDGGQYVLGDDALAVLKDIKRWLRLYDDKANRLDVARLLAEANLVKGDLLEIFAAWPETAAENSLKSKIALYSVDLLTQLTWPIEKDEEQAQIHHFFHIPYLQAAQLNYKRHLLNSESTAFLQTIVRVALPAIAQPRNERTPLEDNIIKVVLYLLRNVALISPQERAWVDESDDEVSRSATIDAFQAQNIFDLILTLSSSMSEDFTVHDVEVLDILFHLLKGIDGERLFMQRDELVSVSTRGLQDLISEEKSMLASYSRHAPSRHNRFGTMMWLRRDGGNKVSTVFGQGAVASEQAVMNEIDHRKKWKKPRRGAKSGDGQQKTHNALQDVPAHLTGTARNSLRNFVERFLDSSFNPLFTSIRRAIEREADRILDVHSRQYFYLTSWFLKAESVRRKRRTANKERRAQDEKDEVESFTLIACVLTQENFVLLSRSMQKAQDEKRWEDLKAQMKCFTRILETVQEMWESDADEDQEISENILNRVFYEQTTHDRIISLLKTYKDQGFGYLDACTELAHVFLRLLESYSKQNVDMQVRSRKRARAKKNRETTGEDPQTQHNQDDEDDGAEIRSSAQRISTERKFDFTRFAARFVSQASVDTFISLLKYYNDLNLEQLKRAHRFLYRVAFKMDLTVYLFRLDIVQLLQKLVKGPSGLSVDCSMFKEWEELTRQVFRRLIRRLEDRPALAIEVLFSKLPSTMFYLEHGYEKVVQTKSLRTPPELEIKPGLEYDAQIGVVVSVLISHSNFDALTLIKKLLLNASAERRAWEDQTVVQHEASTEPTIDANIPASEQLQAEGLRSENLSRTMPPEIVVEGETEGEKKLISSNKHVRLLMILLGFCFSGASAENNNRSTERWTVPPDVSSDKMRSDLDVIQKFEFEPPSYENGKRAEDFIRRKTVATQQQKLPEISDGDDNTDEDASMERLFGQPRIHERSASPEGGEKPKRQRQKRTKDPNTNEDMLRAKREDRLKKQAEKRAKQKSSVFIDDDEDVTDEERDQAFFDAEESRRRSAAKNLIETLRKARKENELRTNQPKTNKRKVSNKRTSGYSDESDQDSQSNTSINETRVKRRKKHSKRNTLPDDSPGPSEDETERDEQSINETYSTPASSQRPSTGHSINMSFDLDGKDAQFHNAWEKDDSDKENTDATIPVPGTNVARFKRRARAGFIIDDDSDEG